MKQDRRFCRQRRPLRVMFLTTSMPVGGAETLLVNLVRALDRSRLVPQVCCLKEPGPLGERLERRTLAASRLLAHKYDLRVLPRLARLMRRRHVDAVVTVGAGDKMFWGRLAARLAGVPVVVSALHSTGWPDRVERINRWLTPYTDAFVAVAERHRRYLVREERFPADRVVTIRNGVDTERFRPGTASRSLRADFGIPPRAPLVGMVGALRHEKNHGMFLAGARHVLAALPEARFLIVGDGPRRESIVRTADRLGIGHRVHLLGTRHDIPEILNCLDVFVLSSTMEASPVAILEAMACGLPVVATRVGSVEESVHEGTTGTLVPPDDVGAMARGVVQLLADPNRARDWGAAGRAAVVRDASLMTMVRGYETLIERIYARKRARSAGTCGAIRC